MDFEGQEFTVKETWLSKKPAEGSGLVAATSFLAMMGFSLLYWSNYAGLASQLPASMEQVLGQGQYWRLFTSIFVHSDWSHLLSNSLGVCGLSFLLYGYFGFKIYPLLTLFTGAAVMFIALATYPPQTCLLGASGVVYLMAGFWLTLYVGLERRFPVGKRIFRVTGFLLIVMVPTSFSPEISYRTHAIGFAVGILVAVLYFLPNKNRFRGEELIEIEYD